MVLYFCIDKVTSSFEKTELENCINHFGKVVLVTTDEKCLALQTEKLKVIVINFSEYSTAGSLIKVIRYTTVLLKELFSSKKYFSSPKLFIQQLSSLLRAAYMSDKLRQIISKETPSGMQSALYSFWFNQFATAACMLKQNSRNILLVARAHGTDLFEERVPITKRIAFREFQMKFTDLIFSVSKKGSDYLKNKYPVYAHKVSTSYLGTTDQGINPFNKDSVFTIVSCARIRNIKRIHLIPSILLNSVVPVRWIHIGSENKNDPTLPVLYENLKQLETNRNVRFEFTGDLTNDEVFDLYRTTSINLFLSVSETEGLPVSMMEAISFGIPVMATNVGGCSEIVTDKTGVLIPKDFSQATCFETIMEFSRSEKNTIEFRNGTREFWKSHFENTNNFMDFAIKIKI